MTTTSPSGAGSWWCWPCWWRVPPERAAARAGDLAEAPVVITEGAQLPLAGLLLALPALGHTGLLETAAGVFPPMRKGFYGLRATLLMLLSLALLREPRADGATRVRPADLGRVLGLDQAPEVKTIRCKLAELAGHGRGAALQAGLARHHASTRPDAVGFLYVDGHVRVYTGTTKYPQDPHRADADRRTRHGADLGRRRRAWPGCSRSCGR